MLDVFRLGAYAQPPCTSCRPGPDGVPGVAWTLLALGAFLLLLGIGVLAFASRTDADAASDSDADAESDAQPAAGEPTPVMDAVQREDLERRAAQEQDAEPEKDQSSDTAVGGSLIALGLGVGVIGLVVVGIFSSRVNDDKSQLRMAATNLVSGAIDGPGICRVSATMTTSTTSCAPSPREYAQANDSFNPGVFIPVEYVFSPSYTANGEITVHDTQDNRSMCVRVPGTDVQAAAQPAPSPSTDDSGDTVTPSTSALPFFDEPSIDPSPYISSGACPDAPITSSSSY